MCVVPVTFLNSSSLFTVSDMVFSFISTVQHGAHKSAAHGVPQAAPVAGIIIYYRFTRRPSGVRRSGKLGRATAALLLHGNYGRYRLMARAARKQTIRYPTASLSLSCTAPPPSAIPPAPRTYGSLSHAHSPPPAQHPMMAEGTGRWRLLPRVSAPSSPGDPNIDRRPDCRAV